MTAQTDLKQKIRKSLEPMFKEAREKGLWFHASYQDIWRTPDELSKAQEEGRLCWGPENWTLRSPFVYLEHLKSRIEAAELEYQSVLKRMS